MIDINEINVVKQFERDKIPFTWELCGEQRPMPVDVTNKGDRSLLQYLERIKSPIEIG